MAKVSDVLSEAQMVKVKLIGFDDRGKTKLLVKLVEQTTGADLGAEAAEAAAVDA